MKIFSDLKECWTYTYGSKSHLNTAGKLVLGVPLFPIIAAVVIVWVMCDALFTKEQP